MHGGTALLVRESQATEDGRLTAEDYWQWAAQQYGCSVVRLQAFARIEPCDCATWLLGGARYEVCRGWQLLLRKA